VEAAEPSWRPVGELLLEKGLVTADELDLALTEQRDSGRLLGAILVERGYVSGPALAIALAEQVGVELKSERGFGTGLWAEIDRRHRAGRPREEAEPDNVVRLGPVRLAPVADPEPEPNRLEEENRRLQEEVEQLRAELAKPRPLEALQPETSHLLLVPTPARYMLVERDGAPPRPGEEVEVAEVEARFVVAKVGCAPFPREPRRCAFLLPAG
jgi:hypothetical protein